DEGEQAHSRPADDEANGRHRVTRGQDQQRGGDAVQHEGENEGGEIETAPARDHTTKWVHQRRSEADDGLAHGVVEVRAGGLQQEAQQYDEDVQAADTADNQGYNLS